MSGESFFVYVIAGGQTLDLINQLKTDAKTATKELEKLAKKYGATAVSSDSCGRASFEFKEPVPEGWKYSFGAISPDEQTEKGKQTSKEIKEQTNKLKVHNEFNKVCAKHCGTVSGMDGYDFEEIDDQIIVKCPYDPMSSDDDTSEYLIPPDSKVISFSQYAKLKEDAGILPTANAIIKSFKFQF